jgi:UDP-glucose 4-epimerase
MTWLLTGGAGYIGAHIVRAFQQAGMGVVVLDDLSTGIRENVAARCRTPVTEYSAHRVRQRGDADGADEPLRRDQAGRRVDAA